MQFSRKHKQAYYLGLSLGIIPSLAAETQFPFPLARYQSTGDHSLYLYQIYALLKTCLRIQVPLTTLKYKIVIGCEHVLQDNFIARLVHYLHQLQNILTEAVLYLLNVSCVKSTFAQQISYTCLKLRIFIGYE